MLLIIGCDNSCTIRTIIAFIALFICILKLFCCFIFVINYLWILFYNKNHHCLYRLVYLYFKIMLMFYIIELYYIVCFSMTNKSMRTFYVNKNSVCLSVCICTFCVHRTPAIYAHTSLTRTRWSLNQHSMTPEVWHWRQEYWLIYQLDNSRMWPITCWSA